VIRIFLKVKETGIERRRIMLKRKPLILCMLVIAMVALFATTAVMAQPAFPTQPNECMVIYSSKATDWFTIGLAYGPNGEWPNKNTCTLGDGSTVEVSNYLYEVTGGKWTSAAYYQTIPGMRPGIDQYDVVSDCSFSSITYIPPGDGTDSSKVPCFGDYLGERALIHYTSAPSGDPPKFGHSSFDSGIGWTSLAVAVGKEAFFCMQYDANGDPIGYGLPGPEVGEEGLIKNTIEYRWVGPSKLKLDINYRKCTFTVYDPEGNPIPQFPVQEIQLTIGNGNAQQIRENWTHGKCDQGTYYVGENSCAVIVLGGYACQYCW